MQTKPSTRSWFVIACLTFVIYMIVAFGFGTWQYQELKFAPMTKPTYFFGTVASLFYTWITVVYIKALRRSNSYLPRWQYYVFALIIVGSFVMEELILGAEFAVITTLQATSHILLLGALTLLETLIYRTQQAKHKQIKQQ